jgi:two-component system, LuxR family, sensor kinase FixL
MPYNKNSSLENASRLRAIIDTAIDGIITIDSKGNIETVNPAAANLFGYHPEEMVGNNINMLMPEPDHSAHDQYLKNYNNTGIAKIIGIGREVKGKKKDGAIFPFLLSISEVQLEDKKIYTGIVHDITGLKKAEIALKESEHRMNSIISTAVDGIITISARGLIEMVNPSALKMFRYESVEELLGKNINVLMPEPDKSRHDGYIENYQRTGHKKIIGIGREVTGLRKDGTIFPFTLSVSEMNIEGKIVYNGFVHDITERKLAEEQLKKYAAENEKNLEEITKLNLDLEKRVNERTTDLAEVIRKLEITNESLKRAQINISKALQKEKELNELKSRFVTMASHEFRTPLSTILSSASLISKYTITEDQDKRDKHIDRIKSAVSNLTGILNDFLSLSQLEEGKVQIKPVEFNLSVFCEEVIDEMRGLAKKEQRIKYEGHGTKENIFLDKHLMKNILINLISNAIKYSPEGKAIFLKTELSEKELSLQVQDQGIGIPKEEQEHLFSRFFRANNAGNVQGTGLGLNIVRKYVELLNGSITFNSEINKGSVFYVKIPIEKL